MVRPVSSVRFRQGAPLTIPSREPGPSRHLKRSSGVVPVPPAKTCLPAGQKRACLLAEVPRSGDHEGQIPVAGQGSENSAWGVNHKAERHCIRPRHCNRRRRRRRSLRRMAFSAVGSAVFVAPAFGLRRPRPPVPSLRPGPAHLAPCLWSAPASTPATRSTLLPATSRRASGAPRRLSKPCHQGRGHARGPPTTSMPNGRRLQPWPARRRSRRGTEPPWRRQARHRQASDLRRPPPLPLQPGTSPDHGSRVGRADLAALARAVVAGLAGGGALGVARRIDNHARRWQGGARCPDVHWHRLGTLPSLLLYQGQRLHQHLHRPVRGVLAACPHDRAGRGCKAPERPPKWARRSGLTGRPSSRTKASRFTCSRRKGSASWVGYFAATGNGNGVKVEGGTFQLVLPLKLSTLQASKAEAGPNPPRLLPRHKPRRAGTGWCARLRPLHLRPKNRGHSRGSRATAGRRSSVGRALGS